MRAGVVSARLDMMTKWNLNLTQLNRALKICSYSGMAHLSGDLPSLFLSELNLGLLGVQDGLCSTRSLPGNGLLFRRQLSKSAM